jgi:hypothetical protein
MRALADGPSPASWEGEGPDPQGREGEGRADGRRHCGAARPSPGSLSLATLSRDAGEGPITRHAELLILCARIGFNP